MGKWEVIMELYDIYIYVNIISPKMIKHGDPEKIHGKIGKSLG
jgi:hypothetical protein